MENQMSIEKPQERQERKCANYEFFAPLMKAFLSLDKYKYECKTISDEGFLKSGVSRCLRNVISGREWVQLVQDLKIVAPESLSLPAAGVGNFFDSLKSNRRLQLVKSLAKTIVENQPGSLANDPFKAYPELDEFAIYAGDGHSHAASEHETRVDGKKYPPCHLYMLNLRNNLVTHMDVSRPKNKKEHEISMLKRLGGKGLRMGHPNKTKLIHIYDKAVIDYKAWRDWKHSSGVYIITLSKCNMAKLKSGIDEVDHKNPVNAGVISSNYVGAGRGLLVRLIEYKDPDTGKIFEFITTEMNLEPGIICYMYKMRWSIEKVFDEFKNSFYEQKAWAKTTIAKSIQANFICIVHNLMMILQEILDVEEDCREEKLLKERAKEIDQLKAKCLKNNIDLNPMLLKVYRPPQVSRQFLRWMLIVTLFKTSWEAFVTRTRELMEEYIS
jgi:hypothetical protein